MTTASGVALPRGSSASEYLRPAASALATVVYVTRGVVIGYHPVIGLPLRGAAS